MAKEAKVTWHKGVLFTSNVRHNIQPSISPKTIKPISTKFIYFLYMSKLKEIAPAIFKIFIHEIAKFFHIFFFTWNYK